MPACAPVRPLTPTSKRHRRIHAARSGRTYTDAEGAWNFHARGTAQAGARFEATLELLIDRFFEDARKQQRHEPREAYVFDALLALADQPSAASTERRPKPRHLALLRVDLESLTRGRVEGDEVCEIAGIGPVPVGTARQVLGDAILKLVITKGVDVANVVHLGRGPTAAQRVALLWSTPKCTNEACSRTMVEIDHRDPWAKTKHTVLHELDGLCHHDHDLTTQRGWSLVQGTGRRAFVAPIDPRHPRSRPPP